MVEGAGGARPETWVDSAYAHRGARCGRSGTDGRKGHPPVQRGHQATRARTPVAPGHLFHRRAAAKTNGSRRASASAVEHVAGRPPLDCRCSSLASNRCRPALENNCAPPRCCSALDRAPTRGRSPLSSAAHGPAAGPAAGKRSASQFLPGPGRSPAPAGIGRSAQHQQGAARPSRCARQAGERAAASKAPPPPQPPGIFPA